MRIEKYINSRRAPEASLQLLHPKCLTPDGKITSLRKLVYYSSNRNKIVRIHHLKLIISSDQPHLPSFLPLLLLLPRSWRTSSFLLRFHEHRIVIARCASGVSSCRSSSRRSLLFRIQLLHEPFLDACPFLIPPSPFLRNSRLIFLHARTVRRVGIHLAGGLENDLTPIRSI